MILNELYDMVNKDLEIDKTELDIESLDVCRSAGAQIVEDTDACAQFDEPVDVVTWDSFSAFRRRVSCTIDRRGRTAERTSDGRPHMELAF